MTSSLQLFTDAARMHDASPSTCFSYPTDCRTTFMHKYAITWAGNDVTFNVSLRIYTDAYTNPDFRPLHVSTELSSGGYFVEDCPHANAVEYMQANCTCSRQPCILMLFHTANDLPTTWQICDLVPEDSEDVVLEIA